MKSTTKNGSSEGANGARGARDENSVLFSLHALMAKEEGEAPPSGRGTRDESGLIDIKALAAAAKEAPQAARAESPPEVHVAIFPFEAPVQAPVFEAPQAEVEPALPAKKTSPILLMLLGAGAVVALAAGLGLAFKTANTPAIPAKDGIGSVAEAAQEKTAALPKPEAPAADSSTKNDPKNPSPGTPAPPPRDARNPRSPNTPPSNQPPSSQAQKTEQTQPQPPAQTKKADPCGGDLMCAMRRAAEKR